MEKSCDRFAKNCKNKYPRISISLSISFVMGNLREHLSEGAVHRCSQIEFFENILYA